VKNGDLIRHGRRRKGRERVTAASREWFETAAVRTTGEGPVDQKSLGGKNVKGEKGDGNPRKKKNKKKAVHGMERKPGVKKTRWEKVALRSR